ncbi:hypothetical protein DIPPA_50658 [Diplonema papillatum]|nr:hypothetical protein DIPPA_50658 [Diplonema papillatum]
MFAKELIDAVTDQLAHGATDVALVNEVPWGMLILQQDVRRLRDVARDSAVERVKISGFRIADEVTAIELGSFLTDHATLKSVDLSYSMLGSYAATVFSDISTMAISHLNLSCAGINVKAITDLALKLDSVSSSLRSLLLPYNAITLQGLGILLKWGCGLTSVDARYCGMLTGAGEKLDFLTEGLLENTSCASLLLSGNGFAPSDQALLRQTARGNRRSGLNRPGAVVFSDVSMKDVIVPDLLEEMRVQNEKQQEVIRRAGLTSEGTADWPLDLPSQAAPHRELAPVFEDIERLNCAPRVVSAPTARDAALFGAASCDNSPSSRALSGSYGSTRTIHSRIVEATRLLQNAGSNSDDASSSRSPEQPRHAPQPTRQSDFPQEAAASSFPPRHPPPTSGVRRPYALSLGTSTSTVKQSTTNGIRLGRQISRTSSGATVINNDSHLSQQTTNAGESCSVPQDKAHLSVDRQQTQLSSATSNATTPMGDLQTTSFTRLHSSLSDSTLSFTRGTQSSQNRLKAADEYDDKGHLMGRIPASKWPSSTRHGEPRSSSLSQRLTQTTASWRQKHEMYPNGQWYSRYPASEEEPGEAAWKLNPAQWPAGPTKVKIRSFTPKALMSHLCNEPATKRRQDRQTPALLNACLSGDLVCHKILGSWLYSGLEHGKGVDFGVPLGLVSHCALPHVLNELPLNSTERVAGIAKLLYFITSVPMTPVESTEDGGSCQIRYLAGIPPHVETEEDAIQHVVQLAVRDRDPSFVHLITQRGYEAARVDENRQARALLKMHKKLEDNVGKRNRHSFSAIRSRSATRYPPSVEVDTSSSNVFTTSQRSIRSQSLSCFERRPWNSGPFALNDNRLDKPAPVNVKDHVLKYYSRPERLLYRVQQQPDDHEPRVCQQWPVPLADAGVLFGSQARSRSTPRLTSGSQTSTSLAPPLASRSEGVRRSCRTSATFQSSRLSLFERSRSSHR